MGGPVCEGQMDDVAALQTSTQKEARATFAEFEASIGRELGKSGTVESTVRLFSVLSHDTDSCSTRHTATFQC
jgi:hypothetical protein